MSETVDESATILTGIFLTSSAAKSFDLTARLNHIIKNVTDGHAKTVIWPGTKELW